MTTRPRTRFDHDAAKAFWIALDPHKRRYALLARQFGVSPTAIRTVARRDNWEQAAADADAQAARKAIARAVRTREERVAKTLGFVDAYVDKADELLDRGELEVRAGDVPQLVKLAELLEGEATNRVEVGDVQAIVTAVFAVAGRFVPRDRRDEFLGEVDGALAGLVAIEGGQR